MCVSMSQCCVAACKDHSMDFELSTNDSSNVQCQYMTTTSLSVPVFLPYFAWFLQEDAWARSHSIKFYLINSYCHAPEVLRCRLLEPLRDLVGAYKLSITHKAPLVPPAYAENLVQHLLWHSSNPRDWLQQMCKERRVVSTLAAQGSLLAANF